MAYHDDSTINVILFIITHAGCIAVAWVGRLVASVCFYAH